MKRQRSDKSGDKRVSEPRRRALGMLGGGVVALGAAFLPGGRNSQVSAAPAKISDAWIDFDFPEAGMKLRRVIVSQRAVGKVTAWNGRKFGLMPTVLASGKEAEITVFDLSHRISATECRPKLLKKIKMKVGAPLTSLKVADDQGFRLTVSRVTTRDAAPELISGAVVDGEAFDCSIDCCVHCSDDPPGHDTCGSAVCCNIPCGPSCGMCVDPGGNTHVCDKEPI